ncbi:hypothetical protein GCM10029992_32030 [Glycomyces albus]
MFAGTVTQMWRWPVKGLRGESVRSARVGPKGMEGDRVLKVFKAGTDDDIWPPTHPRMLGWESAWPAECGCEDGVGGSPVVYAPGGAAWASDDPGLGAALAEDVGSGPLELRPVEGAGDRILVVFEASLKRLSEEMGREIEIERFRPNVMVVADAEPYAETSLRPGLRVKIGSGQFTVQKPCERCVFPSWDPFGRERDKELHQHIVNELGNHFGVYLRTAERAEVRLGDPVAAY